MKKRFNSQVEIWEWLFQGGEVYSKAHNTIKYKLINKKVHIIRSPEYRSHALECISFYNYRDFTKTKEIEWYFNIPKKGILCKCWDNIEDDYNVTVITEYRIDSTLYPFRSKDILFKNAIPLTYEDVEIYLYEGNNDE